MLTPDEAVKIPPVLDLPPVPPPKFNVIRQRIPAQGCPWIVCPKEQSKGMFYVPFVVEQRKPTVIFTLRRSGPASHYCFCTNYLRNMIERRKMSSLYQ